MKRNLILSIIACGAILALCPALRAQGDSPAPATPGGGGLHGGTGVEMLEKLTAALGLTADQQGQIKQIVEAARAQIMATRQTKSLTPEEKMAKAKEVREEANSQIVALLTPEQQAKFAELKEKIRDRREEGGESEASATPESFKN